MYRESEMKSEKDEIGLKIRKIELEEPSKN